ncbi:hypothetical protein [Luteolibacter sp. Populi]|uniref:hypothetical protein n=1 Tax=Luteolibacter sp. Populi TaxID=3230487 RepID=UPI0034675008
MKLSSKRIASHAAALLAGLGIAALLPRHASTSPDSSTGNTAAASSPSPDASRNSARSNKPPRPAANSRGAEYRLAWDRLAQESMSTGERESAQYAMLKAWALVDLEGAIAASIEEAWNTREQHGRAFRAVFDDAFLAEPLESWKILSKFGLGTGRQRDRWAMLVGVKNPQLVFSVLGEMTPQFQTNAIGYVMKTADTDAAADALRKMAAASAAPEDLEERLASIYRSAPVNLKERPLAESWRDLPAGADRLALMTGWANGLSSFKPDLLATDWAKVPAADRAQAARLLLGQMNSDNPGLPFAVDRIMETGQWDLLRGFFSSGTRYPTITGGDPEALATWAIALPAREELRDLFQLALTPKLAADPAAARDFLDQLPPTATWQRDQGYAALAQAILNHKTAPDPAAARNAIQSITDPEIRRQTEEGLADWELSR